MSDAGGGDDEEARLGGERGAFGEETQELQRVRVGPLDVVDGKQERPGPGESPEHSEHRDSDDPAARLAVAVTGDQQGSGQRSLLDGGQSRQLQWV